MLIYFEQEWLFKKTWKRNMKCFVWGGMCLIITSLLLIFIIPFALVPLIYEKSVELQRKTVFPTSHLLPANPEFNNFTKYGIRGARNFYVVVDRTDYVSLGVWHLLPHSLVNDSVQNGNFDYSESLARSDYPVLLHFHSSGGNRIKFINMYSVLRIFFHVIAFDYRGYGDSSDAIPSEEAIVYDSIQLYKWLLVRTRAEIYLWGHSLGAALSTHTVAKLQEEKIVPMGLFLEAPFTSMRDQIQQTSFHKVFSWLPWYESTMVDPLEKNGLVFDTTRHITMVECPIMIVHAKDDGVSPYSFAEKVYETAIGKRNANQGNVTLHLLPTRLHCGHFSIRKAPELLGYIRVYKYGNQFNESIIRNFFYVNTMENEFGQYLMVGHPFPSVQVEMCQYNSTNGTALIHLYYYFLNAQECTNKVENVPLYLPEDEYKPKQPLLPGIRVTQFTMPNQTNYIVLDPHRSYRCG